MPPPGVPDWIFPTVIAASRLDIRDPLVWVEAIGSRRGEIFVRFRDVLGPPGAGTSLAMISRRSHTLTLDRFLEAYSSAEGDDPYVPFPPEEPALIPVPYLEDEDEIVLNGQGEGLPTAPSPEEPAPRELDHLGMLAAFLCLTDMTVTSAWNSLTPERRDQVLALMGRIAENFGWSSPRGKSLLGVYGDAIDTLLSLFPEKEGVVPTSRFEREDLL